MNKFVDDGGKITEEGWKALTRVIKEREQRQAGGEHRPARKSEYIRKVTGEI